MDLIVFTNGATSVAGEAFGDGDGSTTAFSATAANTGIAPGTLTATDGTETFTDNADGTLTGSASGTGTVNYRTGAVTLTFNAAPATGTGNITISYDYLAENKMPNSPYPTNLGFRAEGAAVALIVSISDDGVNWQQHTAGTVPAWGFKSIGVVPQPHLDVRASAKGRLLGGPVNAT